MAVAIATAPIPAAAYCRQNSCQDADKKAACEADADCDCELDETACVCERDEDDCISEGNTLFYASKCINFAVAEGQAELLGVTDERFDEIVTEAFDRWASVDCGGGESPGLVLQSAGVLPVSKPFFCGQVALNISVWFLTPEWQYDAAALGYTTSTYAEDNAEVFDADVELNAERILDEVPSNRVEEALLSIVTHEAGHFLGLAHSNDPDAVMYEAYNRNDLLSRELTQDDIDGICATFPPEDFPGRCSEPALSEAAVDKKACAKSLEPPSEEGCSVAPVSARGSWSWYSVVTLVGLCALWRRRRI